ncbi:MAG TPA: MBG domain-containing protein [Chitinophagaceae bacterium]|jgi:hypothetical protein|nr:MBG domain-containing protein [Chitinophagaceae bacterium]
MKKGLLICAFLLSIVFVNAQTTYYWVGNNNDSINVLSNWNTVANSTGTFRTSNSNVTDILVFDNISVGGNPFTATSSAGISCAQLKFFNNSNINLTRIASGTTTVVIAGEAGDDFFVDASSKAGFGPGNGSFRIDMNTNITTGRVNGEVSVTTNQQFRFNNPILPLTGIAGSFVFTSGSKFYTNITGASSYPFGSSSQNTEKWVVFEAGSELFYDGGNSPLGSGGGFSAIDMKTGSTWHHRATNTASTAGNFFNRKSYGNIIVENNATLLQLGTVYQIDNLTVNTGSTFTMHTSGQTVVLGNMIVNGDLVADVTSTNELILAGNTPQSITGSGAISLAALIVADNASVTMGKDIAVDKSVNVFGKLDFASFKLSGNGTFKTTGLTVPAAGTGNLTAGSSIIRGNVGITSTARGLLITGTGIAPNTAVVSVSVTGDSLFVSHPVVTNGTGVALSVFSGGATMLNANTNGFNPASGSVQLTGTQTFNDNVNYIINAATTWPFGTTTASTGTPITAKFIEVNAPITVNRAFTVSDHLKVNGKITLRPLDIVKINSGGVINGTFNASNYIATVSTASPAELSVLQYDGLASATTLPVGTASYYLPVTLTPSSSSGFTITVFEGITQNGTINGTPFTPSEKQNVVNAVWSINRLSGTGNSDIQLGWNAALEGSTFATLPNTDIGLISNNGSSWSLPTGTANNTTNIANANIGSFGPVSVGAIPQVQPFLFNALPPKTYGNPDFNGGATSLNTTQPIVYTSSNPAVATIVGGLIHITGTGTSVINASQASDGFYPAASVSQTLTVGKAALTITADNKIKFEGQANPALTATYTGFVLLETPAVLLTPANITTTAVLASPPGAYPITVNGATAANYTITFVNGTLTVQPKQNQTITFLQPATKTYGNADFATTIVSTNNTIPVTIVSSNPAVAIVAGNNFHIVGAGTTTITASQAGNAGYFPAPDVSRILTVNKANLAITVRDTIKIQGQPNPPFTISYSPFVLGETPANLLTPVVATTTAIDISSPGYYPITLSGATSNNYNIVYVNARLTVFPLAGTSGQYMLAYLSNPTTLTVRVFSPEPRLGDIVVYDMSGRPMVKKNIFMPAGFISVDMPVATLPSGIYTVSIRGNGVDLQKTIPIIK